MRDNGTPPHTSSDGLGDGYDEDAMIYDDDDDFDEDDMIEIVDDDNDGGNLADDEEDEQMNYGAGPGMEGFTGQQPDHILTSHLENAVFCCCFDGEEEEDDSLMEVSDDEDEENLSQEQKNKLKYFRIAFIQEVHAVTRTDKIVLIGQQARLYVENGYMNGFATRGRFGFNKYESKSSYVKPDEPPPAKKQRRSDPSSSSVPYNRILVRRSVLDRTVSEFLLVALAIRNHTTTHGNKLITGGEDDLANVWDSTTIATQSPSFKCRGHKDSVVNVSFNWDSTYLSSCDLSGIIKIWKTTNYESVATFEAGELSWSFWHTAINVLFAGCDDGSIYMWKIPNGDCKIYTGSSTKCECGVLLPDGKHLLAGYADGTLKIFDLKSGEVQHNLTKSFKRPNQILCVATHATRQIVASGSANGTVALFNSQNGKLFTTLQVCTPTEEDADCSVEGVAFCPDATLDYLACGSVTGDILIWDLSTMTERMRLHQDSGITKLMWDPKSPFLYTAGLDGVIRVIDARSCTIEKNLGRHKSEILDMFVTSDGSKIASTSEDGSVFLFNLIK